MTSDIDPKKDRVPFIGKAPAIVDVETTITVGSDAERTFVVEGVCDGCNHKYTVNGYGDEGIVIAIFCRCGKSLLRKLVAGELAKRSKEG